jgi:FAD/FMN-containing dehydrogenase
MLTPALLHRTLVVVEYDDLARAGDDVSDITDRFRPIGLEGLDKELIHEQQEQDVNVADIEELPRTEGDAWLLVQFGGDRPEDAAGQAEEFRRWLIDDKGIAPERIEVIGSEQDGGHSSDIWAIRESGLGSTAFPPDGDHWPGWEDSAVPPPRVGDYLRDLGDLYAKHGLKGAFYGHFGQGCIHSRIDFDLRHADGIANYRRFLSEAADLVVSYGGSLSGEHGDGQQRAEFLEKQYGPELVGAMREFKRIWDPEGRITRAR